MDTRTGELLTEDEARRRREALETCGVPFPEDIIKPLPASFQPNKRQLQSHRIGRNEKCPCGSGLKFKKCCMRG